MALLPTMIVMILSLTDLQDLKLILLRSLKTRKPSVTETIDYLLMMVKDLFSAIETLILHSIQALTMLVVLPKVVKALSVSQN